MNQDKESIKSTIKSNEMQSSQSTNHNGNNFSTTFQSFDNISDLDNLSVPKLRWVIIMLSHLALLSVTVVASSLSLTIVAMNRNEMITLEEINECLIICNGTFVTIVPPEVIDNGLYVTWSETEKDYMLQALFWGASIFSPVGGRIGEILGPRWTVSTCLMLIALLNLLYPMAALTNYWIAYGVRVVQGMGQGIIIPSLVIIITRWSTDHEKTLSNSLVQGGIAMGNMIVHPFVGLLISSQSTNHWPSVFYYISLFNLFIFTLWCLIVFDYPETHPYLSQQELQLIISNRSLKSGVMKSIPWGRMLTSPPVLAYLVVAFTYGWIINLISTQIPSFYKQVLNLSFEANGLVNALPWIISFIISLTASYITDYINQNSSISLTRLRKILAALGLGFGSIGLVSITLGDWSDLVIVILVTLSKGLATLTVAGPGTSQLDISPSYAGTLAGLANLCYNLSALAMNQSIVTIIGDYPDRFKWFHFFHVTCGLNLIGLTLFCLMGSAKVQPWDPSYDQSPVNFRTPLNTQFIINNNQANTFNQIN